MLELKSSYKEEALKAIKVLKCGPFMALNETNDCETKKLNPEKISNVTYHLHAT